MPETGPADVAVIILTFNEKLNLPLALDSVRGWAREVFVVDSYSTDTTVDIALARADEGIQVVQHAFENYSAQWNWALTHLPITSRWTMKLDADERVTADFKAELAGCLQAAQSEPAGFDFRRKFFFVGTPLMRGGASSTYVRHLWRTGEARFEDRPVNEHVILDGPIVRMQSFIDHHSESSLNDWISKHNRYSSLEAASTLRGDLTGEVKPRLWGSSTERRMWLKRTHARLPGRHLLFFLYQFIFRLGFLDGRAGFRYAFLRAAFFYWIDLKVEEAQATGKEPEVVWPARGEPHPGLKS
ncbi:MAG: glycosyltransferase family 2 protein [Acidobacteriota bacterium]